MTVAEISDDGKRVEVYFGYSSKRVEIMKTVPGARFVNKNKSKTGHPHFVVQLELPLIRRLQEGFGEELSLGDQLGEWVKRETRKEGQLKSLAFATSAKLKRLPIISPSLYEAIHIGPLGRDMDVIERAEALDREPSYQAADVLFGTVADNPVNGNQPGTGKTLETIASIFEAGTDDGPQLVIAPKTALESTWGSHLREWQPHPVYVSTGTKRQKERIIEEFVDEVVTPGFAGWLVINADQVRYRESFEPCDFHEIMEMTAKTKKQMRECYHCKHEYVSEFPGIHGTPWCNVILDEAHEAGLRNVNSLTARGLSGLKCGKRWSLTGTPMGGKLVNLWSLLHFQNPKVFSSKYRWLEMWTDITEVSYYKDGKEQKRKVPGGSIKHCAEHQGIDDETDGRPDCPECNRLQEDFYNMLAPYMIRRTKEEVLPWLPPKHIIPLWADFGSANHAKQYKEFSEESWTTINGEEITRVGVLDEYMRLKQFSFGTCERRDGKIIPTEDSGKLAVLQQKLTELGIWDGTSDEQAIIFSQFREVVDLTHAWLLKHKVPSAKITGGTTKRGERDRIQEDFQAGAGIRCLVMSTKAGGTSITLDRASNVFILDETWQPDDQEQAEDRAHRASRIHQVTVYYIRTKGSIEEYINQVNDKKSLLNMRVLDLRRLMAHNS